LLSNIYEDVNLVIPKETNMENDVLLMKECKTGSITAFEEIVKIHRDKIYKLVYHIIGNFEDADDVSQEVFIQAYKSIKTFRGDASVSTWLRRIAINVSINHIKRESKHQKNREFLCDEDFESLLSDIHAVPDIIESKELAHKINESIRSLSLNERVIFVLRVQQGLSYQEIANTVGCSQGTVMSRLNRARKKLRDKLKNYIV
jgi:RNA polymerase sigma-70 factor, ECF subfamily